MLKHFLSVFSFLLLSTSFAQSVSSNNGKTTTSFIDLDAVASETLDSAHVLRAGEGGKIFLDEKPLVICVPDLTFIAPMDYDSMGVTYAEDTMFSANPNAVCIRGIAPGEHKLNFLFYKEGEVLKELKSETKIDFKAIATTPLFKNDAIVIGLLLLAVAFVFYTSGLDKYKGFYRVIPGLLLCYMIPALLNTFGVISGDYTSTYFFASRYLLPASLILLCLNIDLKEIKKLGVKAVLIFLAGTLGIVIGGPIALFIMASIAPDSLGADPSEVWRGFATVAGSWIGGGANMAAMKEVYKTPSDIFSSMLLVDVIVANIWMAVLLYGVTKQKAINKFLKADNSKVENLKVKMETYAASIARNPSLTDLFVIVAIGIGGMGLAHFGADIITPLFKGIKDTLATYKLTSLTSSFLWLIVFATLIGVLLSFTKLRSYEGAGASKVGSLFLYILVATIGTHVDIIAVFENPMLFAVGIIWMAIHALVLLGVAKLIKAPFFYVAVGSQANVGGAASAPVVAAEFSPTLAPVGVLLAVLGYAVGTFGALLCAEIMSNIPVG